MSSPIIRLKVPIHNREVKRAFKAEAVKILPDLQLINDAFLEELFDETSELSYLELYAKYKSIWDKACERFENHLKPIYCEVNVNLFENLYKPRL